MHRNRTWQLDSTEAVLRTQRNRILPIEGGDGSTLTLDFTTGVLDPRLSFTRGTGTNIIGGVTYIGSDGLVKYAGTNAPRFDYTGGSARGLLIEGTATNLLQQSADWTVSPWSKPAQITWDGTTYATAPDGTNTAKQITVTGGSSASVAQGIANATNRTVSLWLRAGSLTTFSVGAFDSSGGTTWGNNADSTCSIISGPGSVTQQVGGLWSITGLSTTQWTRVQVFRSSSYGALLVYPGGTGTVTGTGFMWGMQMEAGTSASSLIPTGASQATRNPDSCIMEGTNFSNWWANPAAWAMLLDFTPTGVVPGQTPDALRLINRSSTNNSTWFYFYGATTMTLVSRIGNGTAVENNAATGQTYGNRAKVMHAIAPGVHTLSFNGSTVAAANTIASMPTGINALGIMNNGLSGAGAAGHAAVRSVKFWPTALPQATINSLTTL